MASALNIVATPGDGDAPDNSVPVTLWGAGSGGGGGEATSLSEDTTLPAAPTAPLSTIYPTGLTVEQLLELISSLIESRQQMLNFVSDLDERVTALENA